MAKRKDLDAESDEDSHNSTIEKIPTNKEMLQSLTILKAGVMNLSAEFQIHYDYENFVLNFVKKNKKQTLINDYFKKM